VFDWLLAPIDFSGLTTVDPSAPTFATTTVCPDPTKGLIIALAIGLVVGYLFGRRS
jgi:hypothetical protein